VVQPLKESRSTEQPAYGMLGVSGSEQKTERREGHTNHRAPDPDGVYLHARVKKVQGEEEEG